MRLLLSCISTRHSTLKKHWQDTGQKTACPLTTLGSYEKPKEDLGGLLCTIDDLGCQQRSVDLSMAAGMVASDHGVLVTTFNSIHEFDPQRQVLRKDVISLPFFNALHSISRTRNGYLVASTGLDMLAEFDEKGETLWSWWATDHGFTTTPAGEAREIDKTLDYRSVKFGTLKQTTHVNSAAELPDGRILATLFHQGTVIAIDRDSGDWETVLEGLDHPHSVRVLDQDRFTVADTVHGRAVIAQLGRPGRQARIEEEVDAGTNWLQDCSYHYEYNAWVLVDGQNSRIVLRRGPSGRKTIGSFELDSEWRLYEAHVLY